MKITARSLCVSYTVSSARTGLAMGETLEQQITNCKQRMAVIRSLIEEQRAAGLTSDEAERVLALEAEFHKMLEDRLSAEGSKQPG
jgi:hypothetical protein